MKQKIICACLVLTMCISLSTPVLAVSLEMSSDGVILYPLGHGEYTTVPTTRSANGNCGNIILATASEYADMLFLSETKYLTPTGENIYLLVDKIDIDTDNFDANLETLKTYEIPEHRLEEIKTTITEQRDLGNDKLEVTVFAPVTENNKEKASDPLTTSSFYNYKGYRFKDVITFYKNMSTGMIRETGSGVLDIAKSAINFVISCAGVKSMTFTLFGISSSAYSVFESVFGPVAYGTSGDQISINIIYDKNAKDTYTWSDIYNDWHYVFASDHVDIIKQETYQYYSSVGRGHLCTKNLGKSMSTKNYDNPAKEVVDWGFSPTSDSPISYKIFNVTAYL